MKTGICLSFNHLDTSNGVARAAIGIANYLCQKNGIQVTLRPIYRFDKNSLSLIDERVLVKPILKFYFSGLSKIISFLPQCFIHDVIFGRDKYDIEIGFQHGSATRAVVSHGKSNSKHYVWMHGYDEGLTLKKYFMLADKIVCVSKHNAERLKKELNSNVPVQFCYNPLNDETIRKEGMESIDFEVPKGIPILVSVGRLSVEKGYLRLIDIIYKLKNEGYLFQFWLIGDGPQKNEILSKIEQYKLDNVKLLGRQSNPHKFTSKADLFICSSYSEGYSTACTEAIMLGIPVITTDVSGGKEIISEAKAGLVVGMDDYKLYEGIKHTLDNIDELNKWKEILMTSKYNFSYENRCKKIDEVLEL